MLHEYFAKSLKIIRNGTIRKLGYSFLFAFHSNYGRMKQVFNVVPNFDAGYLTNGCRASIVKENGATLKTCLGGEVVQRYWKWRRSIDNWSAIALSCIISEIKRDIGQKLQFFIPPLHSTPPLRWSPSEYRQPLGTEKLEWCGCARRWKTFLRICITVSTEYQRVTDRQTNRDLATVQSAPCIALRDNKKTRDKSWTANSHAPRTNANHCVLPMSKNIWNYHLLIM